MGWIALLTIGVVITLVAIGVLINRYRFYKSGKRIIGEIIEVKENEEAIINSFNDVTFIKIYKAVIQFKTDDGEVITFVSDEDGDSDSFLVGDEVSIVYDKGKKNGIFLDKKMEFFKLPLYIFLVAILFLSFSLTLYLL